MICSRTCRVYREGWVVMNPSFLSYPEKPEAKSNEPDPAENVQDVFHAFHIILYTFVIQVYC